MEYQLTAEVTPPGDAPELDALQQHGVAALLDEHLEMLADIEGPDGVEIEPIDHQISVHPGGASITWLLEAPALSFAEEAAREVLGEVLEHTELLTDWSVGRCEVIASDEDLAAALGPDGLADLDSPSREELDPEPDSGSGSEGDDAEVAELVSLTGLGGLSDEERAERRGQLLSAAEALRAFGLESFGYDDDADPETGDSVSAEAAGLVAGSLMVAVDVLIEELFADVQSLEESGTPASEHEVLWALHDLPARFADHYTAPFAKKFLLATAVLGYRLRRDEWAGPLTVAEALALHLVKVAAEGQLELAELTDELPLEEMFATFDEYAFDDVDVAALYEDESDGNDESEESDDEGEAAVLDWFEPLYDEDDSDDTEDADADETADSEPSLA